MAITRHRTIQALVSALLGSVLTVVLFLAGGMPALAHSGPYELTITTDGAGGVSVSGKYVEDGHTVEALMDVVVTATGKDGETAGPVNLISSAEGQGIWISPEPFLADGEWTVTATTTVPGEATTTTTFVVAPIAPPVAPEPLQEVSASSPDAPESSPMNIWPWALGGLLLVAGGGTAFYVLRQRQAKKA